MRAISNKQNSVVEVLQDAILSGTLTARMELKQNELAESLEVSRMPIREALFILEYQGLVERLPNNHVRVAELSEGFYEDVFRMGEQEEKQILLLAGAEVSAGRGDGFSPGALPTCRKRASGANLGDYYRDLYPLCCQ